MTIAEFVTEAMKQGPYAALAVYLALRSSKRLSSLEEYCRTVLAECLKKSTEALTENAITLREVNETLTKTNESMRETKEAIRHCKKELEERK